VRTTYSAGHEDIHGRFPLFQPRTGFFRAGLNLHQPFALAPAEMSGGVGLTRLNCGFFWGFWLPPPPAAARFLFFFIADLPKRSRDLRELRSSALPSSTAIPARSFFLHFLPLYRIVAVSDSMSSQMVTGAIPFSARFFFDRALPGRRSPFALSPSVVSNSVPDHPREVFRTR